MHCWRYIANDTLFLHDFTCLLIKETSSELFFSFLFLFTVLEFNFIESLFFVYRIK